MYNVNVYDPFGNIADVLNINDDIQYVGGRVSKGSKHYYKGIGTPYKSHFKVDNITLDYNIIEDTGIFYLGYEVTKKQFQNKFGIFQEKYQPQFSDFIGTCGVKELEIIGNSVEFQKSSVEILKSHWYDKANNQYYFEVNYLCNRVKYPENDNPSKLYNLLEYMLSSNWNFIWDKDSITDISFDGRVSDVGDLFQSSTLESKFGTVYSVLYSLGQQYPKQYQRFLKYLGLQHESHVDYIFNTLDILYQNNVNVSPIVDSGDPKQIYKNAVINYLVSGRNCGHCSFVGLGDQVREQYIQKANEELKLI